MCIGVLSAIFYTICALYYIPIANVKVVHTTTINMITINFNQKGSSLNELFYKIAR